MQSENKSVTQLLEIFADMLAYFQVYPDRFIDYILSPDSTFKLYPYQRIYLRLMARYRKVYITAARGTSKSFLAILSIYLKCIFFPRITISVAAPQKDQAKKIVEQSLNSIWNFIPILKNEIVDIWERDDAIKILFKNGSMIDIIPISQGTRGLRRHQLVFEEICEMDKHRDTIGEVMLPLMADNRRGADGQVSQYEIHKQIFYITTASSKQSFAYEQLYEVMVEMAKGNSAFVIGNDYTLPAYFNQLDPNYINETKNSPSMTPLKFAKEYLSVWVGTAENNLVQLQDLEKCRVLMHPEFEAVRGNHQYIIAVDVSRSERETAASTILAVFKITPRGDGTYSKALVNIEKYKGPKIYDEQALFIKEKVERYKASMVVIDANGPGKGLVDCLIREDRYPPYSVVNDPTYDRYKMPHSLPLIYAISTNTRDNKDSEVNENFITVISKHDLKLLVHESVVHEKTRAKEKENLQKFSQRLLPHVETSLFIEEVMNLAREAKGNKMEIRRISKKMGKDRYSAVAYGLYYIYKLEMDNLAKKKQSNRVARNYMAIKKPKLSWLTEKR